VTGDEWSRLATMLLVTVAICAAGLLSAGVAKRRARRAEMRQPRPPSNNPTPTSASSAAPAGSDRHDAHAERVVAAVDAFLGAGGNLEAIDSRLDSVRIAERNLVGIILTNQSRLNPQNFITEGDTRTRRITERALRAYGSAIAREIS
jgi:hypothetical protein